jgi:expansin
MRKRARWLAAGAGAVLAAVVGIVLVVQTTGGPACAALASGKATFYELASGGGNCSYVGPPSDGLFVALSPGEYKAAAACGGYLDVTGPRGKVRVKVVDQCPECETGHIDLSRKAFARIADPVQGIVNVSYRAVRNPTLPGPLSFRVKEGSSQFWFAVLVIDHGNPLSTVEVRSGGSGWRTLQRTDFNYYVAESGVGSGPFTIRVTDVYGHRATASGIRLAPAQVQRTRAVMYGKGAAAPVPSRSPSPSRKPSHAPKPSPSPSLSEPPPTTAAAAAAVELRASSCG